MERESFIEFSIRHIDDTKALLEFELKRELVPEDLKQLNPPDPVKYNLSPKILIISGRGPVWLYAYLAHFYHTTKALAVFDPRLNAGIVVETHTPDVNVRDLIKMEVEI